MTIFEMLDALEAGIDALRVQSSKRAPAVGTTAALPPAGVNSIMPAMLDAWMKRASLSRNEFSTVFGVHPAVVERWLTGEEPAPAWVPVSVRSLACLTLSERSKLLNGHNPRIVKDPPRTHPFSRIEEL